MNIDWWRDEAAAKIGPALDGKLTVIGLAQQALNERRVRIFLLGRSLWLGEGRDRKKRHGDACP
ncbi:hypothetical protein AUC69_01935 [Methyloceanibacter superfactus]|uniref:Uncharacterized protein n=1 Tax=Methyloceanibacter superfactus TaxID=1774969 RepID=A0A1E3VR60_9HYPH|nr:hypothetical protein AUC69_01935 [Methyloceanibacter superfactus]